MSVLCTHTPDLSEITRMLHHLLDTIAPNSAGIRTPTRVVTPDEMSDLLSCLMRAGQSLHSASGDFAIPENEIAEYRTEVQRLHALLPSIQTTLLAERARLEAERERVRMAGEWVRRSRETL